AGAAVEEEIVRVALFNVEELSAGKAAAAGPDGAGSDPQLRAAATIVQRVRPDVLVLQEVDAPPADPAAVARRFASAYLATGEAPIDYPYVYAAPVNTGRLSGFDLDDDGRVATAADTGSRAHGDDSFGFGVYPGQYGMAVLSRHPIDAAAARTFRTYPWRALPGNHLPARFYSAAEREVMPLSSKSHWDVPVGIAGRTLHLLVSHPTPPVFDGPEDRNGRRNHDEILFWLHYLDDSGTADGSAALVDDAGVAGGLAGDALFVLAGDLNADPLRSDTLPAGPPSAVARLLAHPRLRDPGDLLTSVGGRQTGRGGVAHPERATAAFNGGMRVDYLLPSRALVPLAGGVFWPAVDAPERALADTASDHHLLWLDLRLP
ncbi:MAG TPA: endonuclease/exonuclease/phosphatase family protein, partial [Thermoanaerobaculia bacterium]|nr:endonuclease/exonuclease/phosphatase family protein [Thermoanaerobaculia bacterium]